MSGIIEKIIKKIKEKPELSGLADFAVLYALEKYLRKNNMKNANLNNLRDSEIKLIVKDVRASLRLSAGQFRSSYYERKDLLNKNNFPSLLKTHSSTLERENFYSEIKNIIKKLNVKSILDLGCGLNPIALSPLSEKYYALDIDESEIDIVNKFFKKNKINGRAFVYDLRKINSDDLPPADLCIILKVFDVLEKRGHKLAEKIINSVRANYFLISFPTKTLSGRAMNHPQRGWIELLLKRLCFGFKILKSKNEIFYLAHK